MLILVPSNDVKEELDGAKKYYDEYLKTGDVSYKDMANDELKHAGILIKKHLAKADERTKSSLNYLEKERQEMQKMFSKDEE